MLGLDSVHVLEAREGLRQLDDHSVDCVVTSPPYWATRNYGVPPSSWKDGSDAPLGLESDPDTFVEHLCEVFDGVARVLKPRGTLWINLGDAYWVPDRARIVRFLPEAQSGAGHELQPKEASDSGFAKKSLCLVPERFALAMQRRGWLLRNKIVWHKPNHMPTSARDRLACTWEHVFLFTRSEDYYFDLDALRVPHKSARPDRSPRALPRARVGPARGLVRPPGAYTLNPLGRNPGDCWSIPTGGSRTGHPAVFPEKLCERPILAGCPIGGLVVDPFMGSGTTAIVARRLGRRFIGFDVNPQFVEIAREHLRSTPRPPQDSGGGAPCSK